jgi:uncharacterized coiled-coil protein SlyX
MRTPASALLTMSWVVASCAQPSELPPPPPPPVVDTVVVVDTVRIETDAPVNSELEGRVSRMEIQLLERDVQLEELTAQLDAARQEVVRNMAKLHSQANRAEAASGMAEAEIAVEVLGRTPGGRALPEYEQAQMLLEESTTEFNAENHGGALYLATQARTLARGGQGRLRGGGSSLRAGESLFALPVPLQTVSRSNVRDGPGLNARVLYTLDAGTTLVGQSYTSQWVRVIDSEGREGWIFNTLLTGRPH